MSSERTIRRRLRIRREGIDVAADVSAQLAVNVGGSQPTVARSTQTTAVEHDRRRPTPKEDAQ